MINESQARTINRLVIAAQEIGEVFDLLMTLAECFPLFGDGDSSFHGDDDAKEYLMAALQTTSFLLALQPKTTK